MRLRRVIGVLAIGAGILLLTVNANAAITSQVPTVRSVDQVVVTTSSLDAPAQVNFDIGMQADAACATDSTGCIFTGGHWQYFPCGNESDPVYGGCVSAQGDDSHYYKEFSATSDISHGISIDNTNYGVLHHWALRVDRADLEVYGADKTNVGDARVIVTGFSVPLEGDPDGVRSAALGNINLPKTGDAHTGRLAGYVTYNGTPLPDSDLTRLHVNLFGDTDTYHKTGSGAFDEEGFGGATNGTSPNYYSTGPAWNGHYTVTVIYPLGIWDCTNIAIQGGSRMDLDVAMSDLGHPGVCTRR